MIQTRNGCTPAKYVDQLRLEAARWQLDNSDKNLKEIAASCGFAREELMRRLFLRSLNLPASAYRSHFHVSSTL
jgi:transcriptional regulator GlxA family with amidase domain